MGRWEERGTLICYLINSPLTPHSCAFSVMSNSLRPPGLQPVGLFCPWDFPGKNTGANSSNSYSRGSSQLKDQTCNLLSLLQWPVYYFTTEPPGKPLISFAIQQMQLMCKRPVIISSKASIKYAYHAKEIFIVKGTTEKYIFVL